MERDRNKQIACQVSINAVIKKKKQKTGGWSLEKDRSGELFYTGWPGNASQVRLYVNRDSNEARSKPYKEKSIQSK